MQDKAAENGAEAPQRFYALDGMRATTLFLVILFHCAMSYTVRPSPLWFYKDPMTTLTADFVVRFVHAFSLPTFFAMAGFFSAMLYVQRGYNGFALNRAIRIGLPFVVGWLTLTPIVGAGFQFAMTARTSSLQDGWAAAVAGLLNGSQLFRDTTMHLWFMYDLIFFYLIVMALAPIVSRIPAAWREGILAVVGAILVRPLLRLPILALLAMGAVRMAGGELYATTSFIPNWPLILGYGLFFFTGWLLYLRRDVVPRLEEFAWMQTLAGLMIFSLITPFVRLFAPMSRDTFFFISTLGSGLIVWLLFFGLTGLFLRHANHASAAVRYFVDASFWIYLMHLGLVIWLQGLLSGLMWLPWIKILIVLGITYAVGFVTYDLFVRSTIIGVVLSGRRYPRVLFGRRAETVPA